MRIFETNDFISSIQKVLSSQQRKQFQKKKDALKPTYGRPLGTSWFRELKLGSKRAYFVCNESVAIFIAASNKKSQQEVIDQIRSNMKVFTDLLNYLT